MLNCPQRIAQVLGRLDRRRLELGKQQHKRHQWALRSQFEIKRLQIITSILGAPFNRQSQMGSVVALDPSLVNAVGVAMPKYSGRGLYVSGDWDLTRRPFTNDARYRGLKERFLQDVEWERTAIYQFYAEKKRGDTRRVWGRIRTVENLFEAIQSGGVLAQQQRGGDPFDEISVNITRDGEILRDPIGGTHRLYLAKIADLSLIPARINAIHAKCDPELVSKLIVGRWS